MATAAEVKGLLSSTSVPAALVDDLVDGAAATWLMGDPAPALAADLALCHPPLRNAEVRAQVMPTEAPDIWRLGICAHDRPGLLASVAGALALEDVSIMSVAATTWPDRGLALLRLFVTNPGALDWDSLGERLRSAVGRREQAMPPFVPTPPAEVEVTSADGDRVLVTLNAPDRVGLLWAIAAWFETNECNVEVVRARVVDGMAEGTFIVAGDVDPAALSTALTDRPAGRVVPVPEPMRWAWRTGVAAAGVAIAAVRTARRSQAAKQ